MARGDEEQVAPVVGIDALVQVDVWRRLAAARTLYLRGPLEGTAADALCAQLMTLDAESDRDVTLYINSPGGVMDGMFAIHDVVQLMRSRVHTVCVGLAASAGSFILATGTGTRSATPNARIMIHQPAAGMQGRAADLQIFAEQAARMRERMTSIYAERTGQTPERIAADTDRDRWFSAAEAVEYGLVDQVRAAGRGV